MKQLTDSVHQLQKAQGANGYLIDHPDGAIVIDPGLPFTAAGVVSELDRAGWLTEITTIALTHYDFDHAGAAARLADATSATTWIGADDAAILRKEVAAGTRVRTVMNTAARAKLPSALSLLAGETTVRPGLLAVPTPGHTPGHVAFFWEDVAFIGDAALVGPNGELKPFPSRLITDHPAADASMRLITERTPRLIAPGHGTPTVVEQDASTSSTGGNR